MLKAKLVPTVRIVNLDCHYGHCTNIPCVKYLHKSKFTDSPVMLMHICVFCGHWMFQN